MAKNDQPTVELKPTTEPKPSELGQLDPASSNTIEKAMAAKAAAEPAVKPAAKAKKQRAWFAGSLALVSIASVAALGFYGWQLQMQNQQQLSDLSQQLNSSQQNNRQQLKQLATLQQQLSSIENGSQETLTALEQRVQQQSKRLQSLSNTSREDWQLAEAEYLLRLAGQRLLMERGTDGATSLLEAADKILLRLDDLDLFSVREKLARDISALKLAGSVDQTGVYLRLASIAEQVATLPLLPNQLSDVTVKPLASSVPTADEVAPIPLTTWQQLQVNFVKAFSGMGDLIKIRQHDLQPQTLLPIDGGLYLQQNIRFSIERAQLALLREEQQVFQESLLQAATLLKRYYATQKNAQGLAEQLENSAALSIVTQLPSINGSLLALQDYTAQLHKLGGADKRDTFMSNQPAAEG